MHSRSSRGGVGRKKGEPKHDALRFFHQGVADQHFGHGIFAVVLLELCLVRLGAIGARLTIDQQHAAARQKVLVLHHGPIHSDDFLLTAGQQEISSSILKGLPLPRHSGQPS
jgi:hypothetical protein